MLTRSSSAEVIAFEPKPQPERFVRLGYSLLDSSAWQSLPPIAQSLYVKIARKYNGYNNGRISYSVREGAGALGVSKSTISRELRRLETGGLTRRMSRGTYNRKTKITTDSEWELPQYRVASVQLHLNGVAPEGQSSCTTGTKRRIDKEVEKEEDRVASGKIDKEASGLPREGKEEKKDSVWVRYDSPRWDLIERYGHQATGKVFFRFGRLDGDWFLKSDLKAIEAAAAGNGGGR
jgi:DNA-binding transcriptional ArsR family regulator